MADNKNGKNAASTNNLTLKQKIGYAAGDCGGVITLIFVGSYLNRYATNILEIPYATLAVILLIWNVWDMFNDPLVGNLMDRAFAKATPGKDKFRPWILASIPVIVFGGIAFFTVPGMFDGMTRVAMLFVLKIVYEWGYTMMNIAMGSLLGAMALNDTERASLSSVRGIGSSVAQLVAGVMIPQLLGRLGENPRGYAITGVIMSVLGGFIIYLHYAWTEERNKSALVVSEDKDSEENKVKVTDILRVFKENRAFLALSLHSVIFVFGAGIYGAFNPYMYADVFGDIGLMAYTSIIAQGLSISLLLIAPTIAKKMGGTVKFIRTCLIAGIIMFVALYAAVVTTGVSTVLYLIISSVAFGLINMSVQLQWGLVSEAIDYNEYITGKRSEGSIYGTFSLTRRIGQTISGSIIILLIGWIGYNPELTNQGLAQSAGTILGIQTMNLLGPAIAALCSWLIFKFMWNIDDELRAKIAAWRENKNK